ncbi:helix-turn-helix transcriptional regulator [Gandjariella thermophila]|uniref:PAS domain-containing protein n=1 Tax=Gandjariella thermophila TaxID=1931992 RepID=A0A4D4J7H1_9PSEU|nr:LuxR C-terminal-related transcriptional regulator [Gandjariella thermophila]GDY29813.1 hypothetical protein GTS_14460 [Gandjariella thermophila]
MTVSALDDSAQTGSGRGPARHRARAAGDEGGDQPGLCLAHLDRDLTVQYANREFFAQFGGAPTDLCGRGFADLVHPSARRPVLRELARLVDGRRDRFATQVIAVRLEGPSFPSTLTGVAVRGRSPGVTAILVLMRPAHGGMGTGAVADRRKLLTETDARVLEGIAAGLSTVPLAARLYLSRQGVEYHVTGLLRKFKATNRAALVSRAYAMGVFTAGTWPPKVVEDFVR